jgi:hypothetical protein
MLKGDIHGENASSAPVVSRLVISDNLDSKEALL